MPQFQWEGGGVGHPWSLREHFSSEELYYRMLQQMPRDFLILPDRIELRMYSALETRWLTVAAYDVCQLVWPWIDVDLLDLESRLRYIEIQEHARGYSLPRGWPNRVSNPCAEIRLPGKSEVCNIVVPKRDRWREVFSGIKIPRPTVIGIHPTRSRTPVRRVRYEPTALINPGPTPGHAGPEGD